MDADLIVCCSPSIIGGAENDSYFSANMYQFTYVDVFVSKCGVKAVICR